MLLAVKQLTHFKTGLAPSISLTLLPKLRSNIWQFLKFILSVQKHQSRLKLCDKYIIGEKSRIGKYNPSTIRVSLGEN